jgi:hypothetical protein
MLLDYNDLLKIPFYDVLDKRLNEDGLKLRYVSILFYKQSCIYVFQILCP